MASMRIVRMIRPGMLAASVVPGISHMLKSNKRENIIIRRFRRSLKGRPWYSLRRHFAHRCSGAPPIFTVLLFVIDVVADIRLSSLWQIRDDGVYAKQL